MVSLDYLISKDVSLFYFQRKFIALLCGLIWHCASFIYFDGNFCPLHLFHAVHLLDTQG